MQVELAEERIILLSDRFNLDHAEGRAWAKRESAFGTVARLGGLLNRGAVDDYQCVYRERRLQPFWRVLTRSIAAYERMRTFAVPVAPEVRSVAVAGETRPVANRVFQLVGLESCREETEREALFDGLTRADAPALSAYLGFQGAVVDATVLARAAQSGTVVVPPTSKSSALVREAVGETRRGTPPSSSISARCWNRDSCSTPVSRR